MPSRRSRVRRYDRGGGRGLGTYGRPIKDGHTSIEVYDSSSATKPHCWLHIKDGDAEATAHLDRARVRAMIARLETWLDRIERRLT